MFPQLRHLPRVLENSSQACVTQSLSAVQPCQHRPRLHRNGALSGRRAERDPLHEKPCLCSIAPGVIDRKWSTTCSLVEKRSDTQRLSYLPLYPCYAYARMTGSQRCADEVWQFCANPDTCPARPRTLRNLIGDQICAPWQVALLTVRSSKSSFLFPIRPRLHPAVMGTAAFPLPSPQHMYKLT